MAPGGRLREPIYGLARADAVLVTKVPPDPAAVARVLLTAGAPGYPEIPTAVGFCMAYSAARLLTRSHVVHTDAVLSVRAAFTVEEVRQLASAAGLSDAKVVPRWPSRFVVSWRKPRPSELTGDSRP